jgi:tetratricopeptide (TPR) repeat protein
VTHFRAALAFNHDAGRHRSAMRNRENLATALRRLGRFDEARQNLATALHFHRETGSAPGETAVLDQLSQLDRQLGEWAPAVGHAAAALELAERLDDPFARAGVLTSLGFALLGARAVTDARMRFAEALHLSRAGGFRYLEAQAHLGLAGALHATGEPDSARASAATALQLAEAGGHHALAEEARAALG